MNNNEKVMKFLSESKSEDNIASELDRRKDAIAKDIINYYKNNIDNSFIEIKQSSNDTESPNATFYGKTVFVSIGIEYPESKEVSVFINCWKNRAAEGYVNFMVDIDCGGGLYKRDYRRILNRPFNSIDEGVSVVKSKLKRAYSYIGEC